MPVPSDPSSLADPQVVTGLTSLFDPQQDNGVPNVGSSLAAIEASDAVSSSVQRLQDATPQGGLQSASDGMPSVTQLIEDFTPSGMPSEMPGLSDVVSAMLPLAAPRTSLDVAGIRLNDSTVSDLTRGLPSVGLSGTGSGNANVSK